MSHDPYWTECPACHGRKVRRIPRHMLKEMIRTRTGTVLMFCELCGLKLLTELFASEEELERHHAAHAAPAPRHVDLVNEDPV